MCGIDWLGLDVHDLAILCHGSLHIIDGIGIVRIGDSGAFAQCGSIYGSPRRRCLVQHRLFIELGTGKAQKKKYRQKESVFFHRVWIFRRIGQRIFVVEEKDGQLPELVFMFCIIPL